MAGAQDSFDFIVVGSGAGGGVLASRLARNDRGLTVLLLEAGSDPAENLKYSVPAFHALAMEDLDLRWDYFIEHFAKPEIASEDNKYEPGRGVFYPRASALGGCTAHHALITVYPDESDWDHIARTTDDSSWSAASMWRYFERSRDWLSIKAAGFDAAFRLAPDTVVDDVVAAAIKQAPHLAQEFWHLGLSSILDRFKGNEPAFDTNHPGSFASHEVVYRIPLSTQGGQRHGVTEFVKATPSHPRYGKT